MNYFFVKYQIEVIMNPYQSVKSRHFSLERQDRHERIVAELGIGAPIATFVVDKNHPNGYELHTILSNGVVVINNQNSGKFITEIVARPTQIKRYYGSKRIPLEILQVMQTAHTNEMLGRNYW